MLGHQALKLTHEPAVAPQGQVGLDALLQRGQPALLQLGEGTLAAAQQGHIAKGRPPPQPQRLTQKSGSLRCLPSRQGGTALVHQPLKAVQVQRMPTQVEQVAGRLGSEQGAGGPFGPTWLQHLAQVGHIHLQHAAGALGRLLAPELVDQPVRRRDLASVQQQHRQQGPLLGPTQHQQPAVIVQDLKRAKNPELHPPPPQHSVPPHHTTSVTSALSAPEVALKRPHPSWP
jgi:hypothetical protein